MSQQGRASRTQLELAYVGHEPKAIVWRRNLAPATRPLKDKPLIGVANRVHFQLICRETSLLVSKIARDCILINEKRQHLEDEKHGQ